MTTRAKAAGQERAAPGGDGGVDVEQRGVVVEVGLRNGALNLVTKALLRALERALADIAARTEVRCMILHGGSARAFCAGSDIREFAALRHDASEQKILFEDMVLRRLALMPLPTIAAIDGPALGGGFELALACDVIVADKTARFAFPELRLGLIPGFGGIPRLERDLGNALVRDLLLSGRSLGATRAHEVGLVAQLVGAGQAPKVARRLTQQMGRFDGRTATVAKRFLKPFPKERLAREKELFCALLTSPTVERALDRFVGSTSALPYLP